MSAKIVLERLPSDPAGKLVYQTEKIKRHRVFILPTTQGLVYGLMLIVMLLGAINYNNSMAYMLCFLLTSLGLVCMLHTYSNLRGLILSSKRPKEIFNGQAALFPIQFDNRLGLEKFSINIERRENVRSFFKKRKETEQVTIGITAAKQQTNYYPIQSKHRGILTSDGLKVSTNFPLGLFVAWSYFKPEYECLVYPAPQGQEQLPEYSVNDDDADYGSQSGADDFSGFRKYKPGDPVHSIAWKAFAREQGLLVKQFSGKGSRTLILSWDSVSHINDIELRLSQLCYWILLAEKASLSYGLIIPNVNIEPGHGNQHKELCLEALARYGDA